MSTETKNTPNIQAVQQYLKQLQSNICTALAKEDGEKDFITDKWDREKIVGGGFAWNG